MENDFLSEFHKLPTYFKINEFEVRDINILNREEDVIDKFLSKYSEIMTDCLFNANEDTFVNIYIEKSCNYSNAIMDTDNISEFLENNLVVEDDSLDSFEELIPKYKDDIKLILKDNEIIVQILWNYWIEYLPDELHNKSLFISWYSEEYIFRWKGLEELNKRVNN